MFKKLYQSLLLILLIGSIVSQPFNEQLIIKNVDRNIMLNGAYPTEQTLVEFKSLSHLNFFRHFVPIDIDQKINKIAFMKSKDNKEMMPFTREQYIYDGHTYALYKVELDKEYFEEQEGQIFIVTVFLNRYVNFPEEITMIEDQKFELNDYKYFVTPYTSKQHTSTYKFDKILNHDKDGQLKGLSTVVFKKDNVQTFTLDRHIVHGVNNDPQVYFSNVERIIEVSHWGNIAITEFYSIKNVGPTLKGQFSRVSYGSQSQAESKNAFRGIEAQLPYDAWGLYYRDEVGNISTSKAFREEYQKKVKVAFVPRFSLLGGWKANWQIGYNLPTTSFLYSQGSHYQLDNINLQYTLEKIVSQNYDLKIILPEGTTNVRFKIGGEQIQPSRVEKSFGYLDFFGKPTYVFENYKGILKKKEITVDYESDSFATLHKPLVLFVAIFSLLAISIVLKRLRFEAFKEEKTE